MQCTTMLIINNAMHNYKPLKYYALYKYMLIISIAVHNNA